MSIKFTNSLSGQIKKIEIDDLIYKIVNGDYSNKPLYEIITADTEFIHPYFDIDVKLTEDNRKVDYLTAPCQLIKSIFNVEDCHLAVSSSHSKVKKSYHIIVTNKYLRPDLMRFIKDAHKRNFLNCNIDTAVYGKTQKFRIVNTSKIGENRILKPISYVLDDQIKNHIITHVDFDNSTEFKIDPISKPSYTPKNTTASDLSSVSNIVRQIDVEFLDDYETWIKIIMAIINVSNENEYLEEGYKLIHDISSKSQKYDHDTVDKIIREIKYDPKGVGLGTLINYNVESMKKIKRQNKIEKREANNNSKEKTSNYDEIKQQFELTNFKVMNPLVYINIDVRGKLHYSKRTEFISKYEDVTYEIKGVGGKIKSRPFVIDWLKDKQSRRYNSISFIPLNCPEDEYNLFGGFEGAKLKRGGGGGKNKEAGLKIILDHINSLVNHDPASFEYFICWLADIIQNPSKLSDIAICIKSFQGAGKGLLFQILEAVIGKKYTKYSSNISEFVDKFGNGCVNKLLVNLDEVSGRDTFKYSEQIKSYITRTTIPYELKGVTAVEVQNFARWIFTTNNNTPMKIEATDRRFVLFESSNKNVGNIEYFKKLAEVAEDKESISAFFWYLNDRDISHINLRRDRPKTSFYEDVREIAKPLIVIYFEHKFIYKISDDLDKTWDSDDFKDEGRPVVLGSTDFFNDYNEFLVKSKFKHESTLNSFARELKLYKGITKKRKAYGVKYYIDVPVLRDYLVESKLITLEPIEE